MVPIIESFRKKRSQKIGKAIATGSMVLNIILVIFVVTLAIVAIIFIKGGVESVLDTWKSLT